MIKEAAKRLLDKGEISQDEYNAIEKVAANASTLSAIKDGLLKHLGPAALAAGIGAAAASALKKPVGNLAAAAAERASGLVPGLKNIMFPGPAPKSTFQTILETAKPIAFTAGAIGGAALVGKELAGNIGTQIGIGNSFNQMQEKVPQLQQYDKEDMKDYFNVVKTYSPKAASNPLVAGALVHKMMMMGGVDHKLVQDISQIETKPRSGLVFDIAANTARSLAGMPSFGSGESSGAAA
jgi:hypothetical protein